MLGHTNRYEPIETTNLKVKMTFLRVSEMTTGFKTKHPLQENKNHSYYLHFSREKVAKRKHPAKREWHAKKLMCKKRGGVLSSIIWDNCHFVRDSGSRGRWPLTITSLRWRQRGKTSKKMWRRHEGSNLYMNFLKLCPIWLRES